MRWLAPRSLRTKITAAFTLIVVGGTVVSTLIGARIITDAMLNQARSRGRQGLEAVQAVHRDQLTQVAESVARAAAEGPVREALRSGSPEALSAALATARDAAGLSFLGYVDARALRVVRADQPGPSALAPALRGPVLAALEGRPVTSTEVLDRDTLETEHRDLPALAAVHLDPGPASGAAPAGVLTDGLVLLSAVPLPQAAAPTGVLYGGILRNNRSEIVDRVEELLYGRERHGERQIGTVALVLDDVWISTNMVRPDGRRATGTVLPPNVAAAMRRGERWSGLALVAGSSYEAACAPVRNHADQVVGAWFVGLLEAPFLAARTSVMRTFLVVCLVGLLIVLALTYALTRTMIRPLEEMASATRRIAAGDLAVSVTAASRDEIGELAASFNDMLASLQTMNRELQTWAHTLEDKVRERSDELVAVQERMARSEKLASVGRLAAGVAHGLNNPLGGIMSLAMLALEDMPADHPLRNDLDTIVKQTLRCREIVKGLLDFSHQSEAQVARTDINALMDSTLALLGRQASFDNIHLVRRMQSPLPPVLIDPGQLQEVFFNLVINAADAMEEHGELTVETAHDELASEVVIRISDTGKGIPPEVMPMLFEPFFTTKKVGQGTGLGLAIAHGVITRAGGRIEVASRPGSTMFTLRLPVATDEGDGHGAPATTGAWIRQPAGR